MRLIIADDEFYARKALIKCIGDSFRACGVQTIEIIECTSAEEVLAHLRKSLVDFVFADIRMGEMDGLELCEKLHVDYPSIQTVIISGYAQFSYAQKALHSNVFRYLLKPVDEDEILNVIQELLKNHMKYKTGPALPQDTHIRSFSGLTDVDLTNHIFVLVMMKLQNGTIPFVENLSCLSKAIHCLAFPIIEIPSQNSYEYLAVLSMRAEVEDQQREKQITEILHEMCEYAQSIYHVPVQIYVSSQFDTEDRLNEAYQELCRQAGTTCSIIQETVQHLKFETNYLDTISQKLIEYYVNNEKISQLEELLYSCMDNLSCSGILKKNDLPLFMLEVIRYLLRFSPKKEYQAILQAMQKEIEMQNLTSLDRAKDYIQKIRIAFDQNSVESKSDQEALVQQLIDFIEKHYSEDINLTDIAQNNFFLHPNYLSKILKDSTGTSFSKYLQNVRMNNAVKLMQQSNLSVSAIAQLVGYNSESYFIQIFKRYYGRTPRQYQRMISSSREG